MADDRKLIRTRFAGIYKREGARGTSYVYVWRAGGRQRRSSAPTLAEARARKAARATDVERGEFHEQSKMTFEDYATEWVERYQGIRASTREDYRRDLKSYAVPFFGDRKRLSEITPRDVSRFVAELTDEKEQGQRLADATIRRIVSPVRSCLSTAVQEGVIRSNPARDVKLPHRPKVEDDENEPVKALSREQLAAFLDLVHPRHRTMFRLLASTGLRISELIALEWRHLHLDGSSPHVKVRQQLYRERLQPPKSKYGRRDVPLDTALVSELRKQRMASQWPADDALVFPSETGTPLRGNNLQRRVIQPVAEEVGAPWVTPHTFRHTCASILFERGATIVQIQRWLGHHSPSFTLATYVHLMGDDLGDPLSLELELSGSTVGTTRAHKPAQGATLPTATELAL